MLTNGKMDFNVLLGDIRIAADNLVKNASNRKPPSTAYCHKVCKAVDKVSSWNADYENVITGLWVITAHFTDHLDHLAQVPSLKEAASRLFRECAKTVLNIQWQNLEENSDVRQRFLISLAKLNAKLVPLNFTRFRLLEALLENPWTDPTLAKIMGGEAEDEEEKEEVRSYIEGEDAVILQLRVDMMLKENCEEYALNLCNSCLLHPELKRDLKLRKTQLSLLYKLGHRDKMQEECQNLSIQEAVMIIKQLQTKATKEICTVLAQTFMVQYWIKQSDHKANKELLRLWIKQQALADKDQDRFKESVWSIAKLSRSTEQILFFIDILREQCGKTYQQMYVDICIFAINVDRGQMETSLKQGNTDVVKARKEDMAAICSKLACLNHHASIKTARICVLTAFVLKPSIETFKAISNFYGSEHDCCGTCSKEADSDQGVVNPATLYEVERLLNMLRPEYLNPDNSFSNIKSVCERFCKENNVNISLEPLPTPQDSQLHVVQIEAFGKPKASSVKPSNVFEAVAPPNMTSAQALLRNRLQNIQNSRPIQPSTSQNFQVSNAPHNRSNELQSSPRFIPPTSHVQVKIGDNSYEPYKSQQQQFHSSPSKSDPPLQRAYSQSSHPSSSREPGKPISLPGKSPTKLNPQLIQYIQSAARKDSSILQELTKHPDKDIVRTVLNMMSEGAGMKGNSVKTPVSQQCSASPISGDQKRLPTVSTLLKPPASQPHHPQGHFTLPQKSLSHSSSPALVSYHQSTKPYSSHIVSHSNQTPSVSSSLSDIQRAESFRLAKAQAGNIRSVIQSQMSIHPHQKQQVLSKQMSGSIITFNQPSSSSSFQYRDKQIIPSNIQNKSLLKPGLPKEVRRSNELSGMPNNSLQYSNPSLTKTQAQQFTITSNNSLLNNQTTAQPHLSSIQSSSQSNVQKHSALPSDELSGSIMGIDDTIIKELLQDSGIFANTFPDIEVDFNLDDMEKRREGRVTSSSSNVHTSGQPKNKSRTGLQSAPHVTGMNVSFPVGNTIQNLASPINSMTSTIVTQRYIKPGSSYAGASASPNVSQTLKSHVDSNIFNQRQFPEELGGDSVKGIGAKPQQQMSVEQIREVMKQEQIEGEVTMDASNNATYRCIICSLAFKILEDLREHVRNVCKPGLQSSSVYNTKIKQDRANSAKAGVATTTVFQCLRCFELCISERGIKEHRLTCKRVPTVPPDIKNATLKAKTPSSSRSSTPKMSTSPSPAKSTITDNSSKIPELPFPFPYPSLNTQEVMNTIQATAKKPKPNDISVKTVNSFTSQNTNVNVECKTETSKTEIDSVKIKSDVLVKKEEEKKGLEKPVKAEKVPPLSYSEISGSGGSKFYRCKNCMQTLCSFESLLLHWKDCATKPAVFPKRNQHFPLDPDDELEPGEIRPLVGQVLHNVVNVIAAVAKGELGDTPELDLDMDSSDTEILFSLEDPFDVDLLKKPMGKISKKEFPTQSFLSSDSVCSSDFKGSNTTSPVKKISCLEMKEDFIKKDVKDELSEKDSITAAPENSPPKSSNSSLMLDEDESGTSGKEDETQSNFSDSEYDQVKVNREAPPQLRDRSRLKPIQSYINETFTSPCARTGFHKGKVNTNKEDTTDACSKSGKESYNCKVCGKNCQSKRILIQHYAGKHLQPFTMKTLTDGSSYFCHLCQKTFSTFMHYMHHVPNHGSVIMKKMMQYSISLQRKQHWSSRIAASRGFTGVNGAKKVRISPQRAKALLSKRKATKSSRERFKRYLSKVASSKPSSLLLNGEINSKCSEKKPDHLISKPKSAQQRLQEKLLKRKLERKQHIGEGFSSLENEDSCLSSSPFVSDDDYAASEELDSDSTINEPPQTRNRSKSVLIEGNIKGNESSLVLFPDSVKSSNLHPVVNVHRLTQQELDKFTKVTETKAKGNEVSDLEPEPVDEMLLSPSSSFQSSFESYIKEMNMSGLDKDTKNKVKPAISEKLSMDNDETHPEGKVGNVSKPEVIPTFVEDFNRVDSTPKYPSIDEEIISSARKRRCSVNLGHKVDFESTRLIDCKFKEGCADDSHRSLRASRKNSVHSKETDGDKLQVPLLPVCAVVLERNKLVEKKATTSGPVILNSSLVLPNFGDVDGGMLDETNSDLKHLVVKDREENEATENKGKETIAVLPVPTSSSRDHEFEPKREDDCKNADGDVPESPKTSEAVKVESATSMNSDCEETLMEHGVKDEEMSEDSVKPEEEGIEAISKDLFPELMENNTDQAEKANTKKGIDMLPVCQESIHLSSAESKCSDEGVAKTEESPVNRDTTGNVKNIGTDGDLPGHENVSPTPEIQDLNQSHGVNSDEETEEFDLQSMEMIEVNGDKKEETSKDDTKSDLFDLTEDVQKNGEKKESGSSHTSLEFPASETCVVNERTHDNAVYSDDITTVKYDCSDDVLGTSLCEDFVTEQKDSVGDGEEGSKGQLDELKNDSSVNNNPDQASESSKTIESVLMESSEKEVMDSQVEAIDVQDEQSADKSISLPKPREIEMNEALNSHKDTNSENSTSVSEEHSNIKDAKDHIISEMHKESNEDEENVSIRSEKDGEQEVEQKEVQDTKSNSNQGMTDLEEIKLNVESIKSLETAAEEEHNIHENESFVQKNPEVEKLCERRTELVMAERSANQEPENEKIGDEQVLEESVNETKTRHSEEEDMEVSQSITSEECGDLKNNSHISKDVELSGSLDMSNDFKKDDHIVPVKELYNAVEDSHRNDSSQNNLLNEVKIGERGDSEISVDSGTGFSETQQMDDGVLTLENLNEDLSVVQSHGTYIKGEQGNNSKQNEMSEGSESTENDRRMIFYNTSSLSQDIQENTCENTKQFSENAALFKPSRGSSQENEPYEDLSDPAGEYSETQRSSISYSDFAPSSCQENAVENKMVCQTDSNQLEIQFENSGADSDEVNTERSLSDGKCRQDVEFEKSEKSDFEEKASNKQMMEEGKQTSVMILPETVRSDNDDKVDSVVDTSLIEDGSHAEISLSNDDRIGIQKEELDLKSGIEFEDIGVSISNMDGDKQDDLDVSPSLDNVEVRERLAKRDQDGLKEEDPQSKRMEYFDDPKEHTFSSVIKIANVSNGMAVDYSQISVTDKDTNQYAVSDEPQEEAHEKFDDGTNENVDYVRSEFCDGQNQRQEIFKMAVVCDESSRNLEMSKVEEVVEEEAYIPYMTATDGVAEGNRQTGIAPTSDLNNPSENKDIEINSCLRTETGNISASEKSEDTLPLKCPSGIAEYYQSKGTTVLKQIEDKCEDFVEKITADKEEVMDLTSVEVSKQEESLKVNQKDAEVCKGDELTVKMHPFAGEMSQDESVLESSIVCKELKEDMEVDKEDVRISDEVEMNKEEVEGSKEYQGALKGIVVSKEDKTDLRDFEMSKKDIVISKDEETVLENVEMCEKDDDLSSKDETVSEGLNVYKENEDSKNGDLHNEGDIVADVEVPKEDETVSKSIDLHVEDERVLNNFEENKEDDYVSSLSNIQVYKEEDEVAQKLEESKDEVCPNDNQLDIDATSEEERVLENVEMSKENDLSNKEDEVVETSKKDDVMINTDETVSNEIDTENVELHNEFDMVTEEVEVPKADETVSENVELPEEGDMVAEGMEVPKEDETVSKMVEFHLEDERDLNDFEEDNAASSRSYVQVNSEEGEVSEDLEQSKMYSDDHQGDRQNEPAENTDILEKSACVNKVGAITEDETHEADFEEKESIAASFDESELKNVSANKDDECHVENGEENEEEIETHKEDDCLADGEANTDFVSNGEFETVGDIIQSDEDIKVWNSDLVGLNNRNADENEVDGVTVNKMAERLLNNLECGTQDDAFVQVVEDLYHDTSVDMDNNTNGEIFVDYAFKDQAKMEDSEILKDSVFKIDEANVAIGEMTDNYDSSHVCREEIAEGSHSLKDIHNLSDIDKIEESYEDVDILDVNRVDETSMYVLNTSESGNSHVEIRGLTVVGDEFVHDLAVNQKDSIDENTKDKGSNEFIKTNMTSSEAAIDNHSRDLAEDRIEQSEGLESDDQADESVVKSVEEEDNENKNGDHELATVRDHVEEGEHKAKRSKVEKDQSTTNEAESIEDDERMWNKRDEVCDDLKDKIDNESLIEIKEDKILKNEMTKGECENHDDESKSQEVNACVRDENSTETVHQDSVSALLPKKSRKGGKVKQNLNILKTRRKVYYSQPSKIHKNDKVCGESVEIHGVDNKGTGVVDEMKTDDAQDVEEEMGQNVLTDEGKKTLNGDLDYDKQGMEMKEEVISTHLNADSVGDDGLLDKTEGVNEDCLENKENDKWVEEAWINNDNEIENLKLDGNMLDKDEEKANSSSVKETELESISVKEVCDDDGDVTNVHENKGTQVSEEKDLSESIDKIESQCEQTIVNDHLEIKDAENTKGKALISKSKKRKATTPMNQKAPKKKKTSDVKVVVGKRQKSERVKVKGKKTMKKVEKGKKKQRSQLKEGLDKGDKKGIIKDNDDAAVAVGDEDDLSDYNLVIEEDKSFRGYLGSFKPSVQEEESNKRPCDSSKNSTGISEGNVNMDHPVPGKSSWLERKRKAFREKMDSLPFTWDLEENPTEPGQMRHVLDNLATEIESPLEFELEKKRPENRISLQSSSKAKVKKVTPKSISSRGKRVRDCSEPPPSKKKNPKKRTAPPSKEELPAKVQKRSLISNLVTPSKSLPSTPQSLVKSVLTPQTPVNLNTTSPNGQCPPIPVAKKRGRPKKTESASAAKKNDITPSISNASLACATEEKPEESAYFITMDDDISFNTRSFSPSFTPENTPETQNKPRRKRGRSKKIPLESEVVKSPLPKAPKNSVQNTKITDININNPKLKKAGLIPVAKTSSPVPNTACSAVTMSSFASSLSTDASKRILDKKNLKQDKTAMLLQKNKLSRNLCKHVNVKSSYAISKQQSISTNVKSASILDGKHSFLETSLGVKKDEVKRNENKPSLSGLESTAAVVKRRNPPLFRKHFDLQSSIKRNQKHSASKTTIYRVDPLPKSSTKMSSSELSQSERTLHTPLPPGVTQVTPKKINKMKWKIDKEIKPTKLKAKQCKVPISFKRT